MNDRFAAQLRKHLLETANDRPTDDQLARALAGVASTTQRHPVAARLAWNAGWLRPIPSAAVRLGLLAAALALATMSGAGMAGGLGRTSTVFEGTWITIDPADGSGMTLVVGAGETPAVYFEDGYATGLACVRDTVKRFTARGTGEISGGRLVATFPDGGGCGLLTVEVAGRYDYDDGADALYDQDRVVWTRALGEQAETQAPVATIAIATPADPECIQFDAPGTYSAPVGSLSLTVAMPGSVAEPWNGVRAGFDVMRAACTDWTGTGWIDAGEVTLVDANACAGGRVEVQSTADAIANVSTAKGIDVVEQTDVTLDGHAGTRFDLRIHDAANPCPDGRIPLVDGLNPIDPGLAFRLYLLDVDGRTLALGLYGYADWEPAVRRDVDGIVASMRIAPIPPG